MHKKAIGLCLLLLGCSKNTSFPELERWQGTLSIEVQGQEQNPTALTLAKRGQTYRFEAPDQPELFGSYGGEGPRHYLFDSQSRLLTMVVENTKHALDYDLAVLAPAEPSGEPPVLKLAPSGRHDNVAGYPCEVWELTGAGAGAGLSAEACVVRQKVPALALGLGLLPEDAKWASVLLDGEHLPLSITVKEGERVRFAAKITNVAAGQPVGSFEVPSDFDRANLVDVLKTMHAEKRAQQQRQ